MRQMTLVFILILLASDAIGSDRAVPPITEDLTYDPAVAIFPPYDTSLTHAQLRVRPHIIQDDNGLGGRTVAEVEGCIQRMHDIFMPHGIELLMLPPNIIQDSNLFQDSYPAQPPWADMEVYEDPKAFDVYFFDENLNVFSYSRGYGYPMIAVGQWETCAFEDVLDSDTPTHEAGHALGLYHVFNEHEDTSEWPWDHSSDPTICETHGDRVCDTRPSVNLFYGEVHSCGGTLTNPECEYMLPPGNPSCDYGNPSTCDCLLEFDPETTNFMQYAYPGCWGEFTPGQVERMLYCIEKIPDLQAVMVGGESFHDVAYVDKSGATEMTHTGTPYSSASLDYDGNGYTDLFVTMQDGPGVLYSCGGVAYGTTGAPEMSDETSTAFGGVPPPSSQHGVSVADFDNDGDDDLFIAHATQPELYHYEYNLVEEQWQFMSIATTSGVASLTTDSWASAWCDFDRDQDLDLFVARAQTDPPSEQPTIFNVIGLPDVLLRNDLNTTGGFTDVTSSASGMETTLTTSFSPTWSYVDADAFPDLLVPSLIPPTGGPKAHLYLNQDDGTFSEAFSSLFESDSSIAPLNVTGTVWTDVNMDGHLDVVFSTQLPIDYPQRVFLWDGSAYDDTPLGLKIRSTGVRALDYDLDGRQDLLFLPSEADDTPRLMRNFSDEIFDLRFMDVTAFSHELESIGRVDGVVASSFISGKKPLLETDGDLDLFLGRSAGNGLFYRASRADFPYPDEPANHYLAVNLLPNGAANASSIGAMVTASYQIEGRSVSQTQILDGGSGRGGQGEHILTFGLGDYAGVVDLSIRWPCGNIQTVSVQPSEYTNGQQRPPFSIADDTVVTVDSGSLTHTMTLLPSERLEWTFTWTTAASSRWDLDTVRIDLPNGQTEMKSPSFQSAEIEVTPVTGGGYSHTLTTWTDCMVGTYHFDVRSSTDVADGTWSDESSRNNSFCPRGDIHFNQ